MRDGGRSRLDFLGGQFCCWPHSLFYWFRFNHVLFFIALCMWINVAALLTFFSVTALSIPKKYDNKEPDGYPVISWYAVPWLSRNGAYFLPDLMVAVVTTMI
jgi:hypothetical protein